jgi:hypothetical protein
MDESHASAVGHHANLSDGIVNKVILAVPEPAHRFDVRGVFRVSLGKFDAARVQEVANAVEALEILKEARDLVPLVTFRQLTSCHLLPASMSSAALDRLLPPIRSPASHGRPLHKPTTHESQKN